MGTKVAIVGQGYVGLPLALAAAESGHEVFGIERDAMRVAELASGRSHIRDVPDETLSAVLGTGRYRPVTRFEEVASTEIVVLCVPTPYSDDAPDLSFIRNAGAEVGRYLRPGTLVILESTTYPGTTEELLGPILEDASGLRAGREFDLAFSPERIDPGNRRYRLENTPKIVGGTTREATARACAFYQGFIEHVVPVSSPRTAEMAKLLENTFRHINIALVNELAVLSRDLDVDIWEVVDAAATKPFGFMPFYPGPGVGGHCIPVDPMYLSWRVRELGGSARFIELARDVNAAMPGYCVTRIRELLEDRGVLLSHASVLVLGASYKANVGDLRESPAVDVIRRLRDEGAAVSYHDPWVPQVEVGDGIPLRSRPLNAQVLREVDCVAVLTNHDAVDYQLVASSARLVFDTRNVVPKCPQVHRL